MHHEVWVPKTKFKEKNFCKNQYQKAGSAPSWDQDAAGIRIS
jgi:hypothetical protein